MKYCVVVANGSRARFFSLEPPDVPELESGPRLIEQEGILEPELQSKGQDLWSERVGKNRSGMSGSSHGYDDHRQQHTEEYERRFANMIAEHASQLAKHKKATSMIVVGNQRQLPTLRTNLETMLHGTVNIKELAKDLAKLTPTALHDHLARQELIPPRKLGSAPQ